MLGGIYGTNTEFDAAGFDVTSAVLDPVLPWEGQEEAVTRREDGVFI